jgi:hypothetical protein
LVRAATIIAEAGLAPRYFLTATWEGETGLEAKTEVAASASALIAGEEVEAEALVAVAGADIGVGLGASTST